MPHVLTLWYFIGDIEITKKSGHCLYPRILWWQKMAKNINLITNKNKMINKHVFIEAKNSFRDK